MGCVLVDCKGIEGQVSLPLSKSYVQRFLIGAFLAGELEQAIVTLKAVARAESIESFADDIRVAIKALVELNRDEDSADIYCGDSGAVARMLMPVADAMGKKAEWHRNPSLAKRPICVFAYALKRHMKDGRLQPGEFHIPGNISSQFVSGLLFALSTLEGDSTILVDGEMQSAPYIDMTIKAMSLFGVEARRDGNYFEVKGGQTFSYTDECTKLLERDWSAAAMWLSADYLLGGRLELVGTNAESLQGDKRIVEFLEQIKSGQSRETIELDMSNYPDIAPCVALAAVKASCDVKLVNVARLRLKECDRLEATARILNQLGADVEEGEDYLLIHGKGLEDGELIVGSDDVVDCCGDHRMVMMAALASIITEKPVLIDGAEAVAKSYPGFFKTVEDLGGKI